MSIVSSPFKTPEFKILFQKWNRILEEDGHKEIEDFGSPTNPLKQWHDKLWASPRSPRSGRRTEEFRQYYELAADILQRHKFKNETHRKIWELHCEGLSIRRIVFKLGVGTIGKSTVNDIIMKIERDSGLKHG